MSGRVVDGVLVPPDLDQLLDAIVDHGFATEAEADAAIEFFSHLADRELAGELTPEVAESEVIAFAMMQVGSRSEVKS
jgi:hypothetical protein